MASRAAPPVLVFDVNETLSDLAPLRGRLAQVGAPRDLFPVWFAGVLRDGFALTAAGEYVDFADLARDGLRALLAAGGLRHDDTVIEHVLAGFTELDVHPDVPTGIRTLYAAGFRLATMTNGSTAITQALLDRADLTGYFEQLLDVRGPQRWKPAAEAYRYVVDAMGVAPHEAGLIAVHPWDIDGAISAGLTGIWLRRGAVDATYPQAMRSPTLVADDLDVLASLLAPD